MSVLEVDYEKVCKKTGQVDYSLTAWNYKCVMPVFVTQYITLHDRVFVVMKEYLNGIKKIIKDN